MKKSKIVVLLLSLALLFGVGNNNLKLDQNVGENNNRTIMKATDDPDSNKEGNITFGTNNVKINAASVTADDSKKNKWTITTVGTTSFTPQPTYYQVGSKNNPATSINFNCIFSDVVTITKCSIKLGGNSGTAGNVLIKFGDTEVGTGSLNETEDVTVPSKKTAASNEITISITGIKKGVKVYCIDYEYATSDSAKAKANINSSDTKAQLKYSFNVTQGESVSSFIKVTSKPSDWSGEYLIVYENGENSILFNSSLETIDAKENNLPVEIKSGTIEKDKYLGYAFTIKQQKDGFLCSIKSAKGQYISGTSGSNTLNTSTSEDFNNEISCNNDGTVNIISNTSHLRYNSAIDNLRFRYFKSDTYTKQNAICLYRLETITETNYKFFNMKMNLGAVIEAAKVQALVDAKLSISSYGVAVAQKEKLVEPTISDAVTNNSSFVSIVSKTFTTIDAMQKTDANGTATSGDYVIFNADLSFPDKSKYNVEVSAVAFFELEDGTYVFFQERTLSVASLAQEYIDKTDVYNTFNPNVQRSLKALAATPASVA